MAEKKVTKTFTITANEELMGQVERFLACLHLFTHWGHSSTLALSQDGDGWDEATVEGEGFDPEKYRVYASWRSYRAPQDKKVELMDPSLKDERYIEYRDGYWTKYYGDLYEGKPQPWMEE